MSQRFILLSVFALLFSQVNSSVHMAEHGFEAHEHDSQICDIYLYGETAKQLSNADLPAIYSGSVFGDTSFFYALSDVTVQLSQAAQPRAPPVFS